MRSTYLALAVGMGLSLCCASSLSAADEKKGANQAPQEAAAKAKSSDEADAVKDIHLAHQLIEFGRKHKTPEALITAARILGSHGTVELAEKATHQVAENAPKDEKKGSPSDDSPKALLEEAKRISNNEPGIVALANSVEISRGASGGPKRTVDQVMGLATDEFRITFNGLEVATVALSGDGDTRLDLYVYDENGNLVTSQVGPGDDCLATWVPRWTGTFIIRIVNRGVLSNRYVLVTN
jgi:hypothetical protein